MDKGLICTKMLDQWPTLWSLLSYVIFLGLSCSAYLSKEGLERTDLRSLSLCSYPWIPGFTKHLNLVWYQHLLLLRYIRAPDATFSHFSGEARHAYRAEWWQNMGLDVAQEGPRPCDNFRPPSTGWKAVGDGDSMRAARPGSWGPQEARVQASLTSHLLPLLTLTVETKENVSKGKFLALSFFL